LIAANAVGSTARYPADRTGPFLMLIDLISDALAKVNWE
jgi:hypothetical protein